MRKALKLKLGRHMLPIPALLWRRAAARDGRRIAARLGFMAEDHHRVRNFVVKEVGRLGAPVSAETIAERLGLSMSRTQAILEDLEKNLTFLFRNQHGAVVWAYPVTAAETPHEIRLQTGERMTAA